MPTFISPVRASSAGAMAIANKCADQARTVHRSWRNADRSTSYGYMVVLYRAGKFIGHADERGCLVSPKVAILAA